MHRRDVLRTLGLALAAAATTSVKPYAASAAPGDAGSGIFALDTAGGVYRDAAIRNYPFVRGYAWRGLTWASAEPRRNRFNFDAVKHIMSRLPAGQVLSLNLTEITGAWPKFLNREAARTWVYTAASGPMAGVPVTMPVPWDLNTQARFRRFLSKLAAYRGASSIGQKLKNDPRFERLAVVVPGLAEGRVGEPTGVEISSIPGYSRRKLIDAVVTAVGNARDVFPSVRLAIEVARITDPVTSPALWSALIDELRVTFGTGLDIWDENLAASTTGGAPRASTSYPMTTWTGWGGVTGFQMLQSWRNPFFKPSATLGTTPDTAIQYAVDTFGTDYFEIYTSDLDYKSWWPVYEKWAAALA